MTRKSSKPLLDFLVMVIQSIISGTLLRGRPINSPTIQKKAAIIDMMTNTNKKHFTEDILKAKISFIK